MRSMKTSDEGIRMNRRPQSPIQRLHRLDVEISHYLSFQDSIWSSTAASTQILLLIDSLLLTIPTLPTSLDFVDDLLQRSMSRLQDEFSTLLSNPIISPPIRPHPDLDDPDLLIPVAYPIKDFNLFIDALPGGIIKDLSEIARRMAAGGFGQECADEYSKSRRKFVVKSVARLGVKVFVDEDIQNMEFSELDVQIQRWNQAVKFVFLILFPSERRLSDRVFTGLMPISDLVFADACKETAEDLLRFAKGIALGIRAPEMLFRIVDMYETMRDLLPEVESVFGDAYSYLVDQYELCCVKLGQAVKEIFVELENLVLRNPVKNVLPGGGVHPITRYVINYLHAAAVTWRTLEEIMADVTTPGGDQLSPSSSLSAQFGWIMERLNRNLEKKSRAYGNESLSCVFLINNGHYMVQKLAESELKMMLGEEWVRGQVGKIRQWLAMYQKRSWSKLITLWQINHINEGVGSLSAVKQKLNYFNTYLGETCGEQKGWVMVDEMLREEVRNAIVKSVIPSYTNFLQMARKELGKQMDNTVRYSPDDVEDRIRELFVVARRKPSSSGG